MPPTDVSANERLGDELCSLIDRAMKEPGVSEMLKILEAGKRIESIANAMPSSRVETVHYSSTSNR